VKTRIHGDFHLGHVLVASGDAFIIDFRRHGRLRRAPGQTSPLRDVADCFGRLIMPPPQ
jgi:maltose alpha-D-glucosyltransferase/alpha-amylase